MCRLEVGTKVMLGTLNDKLVGEPSNPTRVECKGHSDT